MLKKINLVTLAIFALAVGARLIALDQSLWLDEAVSANTVTYYSYYDLVFVFARQDFHPPLYYLLLKLWTGIFGHTEVALRMPSVIFSIGAGLFVYKTMSQKFSNRAAQIATALLLLNPLIIYYSQEARMYSMIVFLLAALTFFALQPPSKKVFIAIVTLTTLSFLTFYGSVFYMAALVAISIILKSYSKTFAYILGIGIAFCAALLFLLSQLQTARVATAAISGWAQVLGTVNLKNLGLIPLKFVTGRVSFEPKIVYHVLGAISCIAYYSPLLKLLKFDITPNPPPRRTSLATGDQSGNVQKRAALFFALTATLPLLFGLIASFALPMLQYFRFIYLLVPLCMLLGIAVQNSKKLSTLLILTSICWSFVYLVQPTLHRENWRDAVATIKTKTVYVSAAQSDPVTYYNPSLNIEDLGTALGTNLPKKITVIPYATEIYGFDYAQMLVWKGYKLSSKREFRGVVVEEWLHNL